MRQTLAVLSFAALVSTSALGQEKVIREADKTVYRQKTTIELNEVVIDADVAEPRLSYSLGKRPTIFGRRFKVRENFNPELQRSVEHL